MSMTNFHHRIKFVACVLVHDNDPDGADQPPSPSKSPRKPSHATCRHMNRLNKPRQQHTCRVCIADKYADCAAAGLKPLVTFHRLIAVSGAYFCHGCMHAAVAAADPRALAAVPTFKSCPAHRERYERRRCPCRRRWTDCADCKGLGVDPRAGSSYCDECGGKLGGGGCACRLAAEAPPPPPPAEPAPWAAAAAAADGADETVAELSDEYASSEESAAMMGDDYEWGA
jgi:hypothetical protein